MRKSTFPILLLAAVMLVSGCIGQAESESTGGTTMQVPAPDVDPSTVDEMIVEDSPSEDIPEESPEEMTRSVKTFALTGVNFKFIMDGDNPVLRVNEGDTVRIEFTSTQGFHDWVVDEFGAATERVREGDSTFVEFVASKKGTYEYYCSVGTHRAKGMFGNFIVE